MVKIDVLLQGAPIRTNVGIVGFCSSILIEGEKRILVDVGHAGRRTVLLEALQARGLTPQDIDITVMSHAHWDHSQNFDLFTHAPMLLHRLERKYAHHPHINDWATPAWTGAMIEHQPDIQEVDDGYQIEPGVSVIHTPGHSPGSISVLVETDDGVCALTGDVLHYSNVALTRRNPLVFWNEKEATKSIDRIVETADLIYPGHDRTFRIVNGEIEYLAEMKMTISGLDRDDPGLEFENAPRPVWIMPGIEDQTPESLG
ncbi:MAG: MBL fold metallo-hydrolase [SAR202 cluster bacterium]|nr:MBL fold metallo-hydrolase [SAR202 cluster bacterium]MDP6713427.1 MBL fold metallo-hydrolase [SAR202 cluster bacterium]|tara:strand:+ start:77 stop:850 length:774 start_codon:yes stop_codon:yes gene_type:complete